MKYNCETCHDSGSKNQTGEYLDCPACDMPMTRKALNDFVKSLGPTHPEDIALAIHQRAFAMAPKQEAPTKSLPEMTDDLIFQWAEGYVFTLKGMPNKMTFTRPRFVAAVRTIIAHLPASVAAPAVANGALPELPDPLEIDWPTLNSNALGCGVEDRGLHDRYECAEYGWQDGMDMAASRVPDVIYDADQMRAYGQACHAMGRGAAVREYIKNGTFKQPILAFAGPDAVLIELIQKHWNGAYFQRVTKDEAREINEAIALAGAKGN